MMLRSYATTPHLPINASVASAYNWLLIFGFPSNDAAASLMPELFTNAEPASEVRPLNASAHVSVDGEYVRTSAVTSHGAALV